MSAISTDWKTRQKEFFLSFQNVSWGWVYQQVTEYIFWETNSLLGNTQYILIILIYKASRDT